MPRNPALAFKDIQRMSKRAAVDAELGRQKAFSRKAALGAHAVRSDEIAQPLERATTRIRGLDAVGRRLDLGRNRRPSNSRRGDFQPRNVSHLMLFLLLLFALVRPHHRTPLLMTKRPGNAQHDTIVPPS